MLAEPRRREYNNQILSAYVVTLLGVFTSVLLWLWLVAPLRSPDVWPLLELPVSGVGRKAPATERDLFVSIRPNGDLFLNQEPITTEGLITRLRSAAANPRHADPQIFVRVDRSATFGSIRPLLRAAQLTRRASLVFLAKPRSESSFLKRCPICYLRGQTPTPNASHRLAVPMYSFSNRAQELHRRELSVESVLNFRLPSGACASAVQLCSRSSSPPQVMYVLCKLCAGLILLLITPSSKRSSSGGLHRLNVWVHQYRASSRSP
jgi:biopolymer transport protein TolR